MIAERDMELILNIKNNFYGFDKQSRFYRS